MSRSPKQRLFDHLVPLVAADGWRLRASRDELYRPAPGGEQRVSFMVHGKHSLWTATIAFRLAAFEAQALVHAALGRPGPARATFVVQAFASRAAYHPLGNLPHLRLYAPGVDVPAREELQASGRTVTDALNPDAAVQNAAAQAARAIQTEAAAFCARFDGVEALRPIAERADLAELDGLSPPGARSLWVAVAWRFDPAWGARLLQRVRASHAQMHPPFVAMHEAELVAVEAALRG